MTTQGTVKSALTNAIQAIEATGAVVNINVEVNSLDRYVIELEVLPPHRSPTSPLLAASLREMEQAANFPRS
ncbi:MAG: hypothetical protein ACRCXB_22850 [Aeromonadaceae bacterium]